MVLFQQDFWKDIPFFKLYPLIELKKLEKIPEIFNKGIEWIQIREKEEKLSERLKDLEEMVKIAKEKKGKIIVNDEVEIAKKIKAQGVHLGQGDFPPMEARKILGKDVIIGLSCYWEWEIEEALENEFLDYIAIGPIFSTPFKDKKPLGLDFLKKYLNRGKPIVAIGGIDESNIKDVLNCGVFKVAFIRFLDKIIL